MQYIRSSLFQVMHLVTPLIAFICQCKEFNAEDFKELRGVIAGAAPIGPSIIEQFVNIFDHYVMFQEGRQYKLIVNLR